MNKIFTLIKKLSWKKCALILALLIAAAGMAVTSISSSDENEIKNELKTTTVRRGSLHLSILGSGSLTSAQQADLSFSISGIVDTLNVKPGDHVSEGDTLAVLEDLETLEIMVTSKELALKEAQNSLQELLSQSQVKLAEAQLAHSNALSAYQEAMDNQRFAGVSRCSQEVKDEYYYEYLYVSYDYNKWASYLADGNSGYGTDYIITKIRPYEKQRSLAYTNYLYCQGYTEQEILESEAALKKAEAELLVAEQNYQTLVNNSGLDTLQIEIAENTLKLAELDLKVAQLNQEGALIKAPFSGTIISVGAAEGEQVGKNTVIISLADLSHLQMDITIDESDLPSLKTGYSVEVIFDAIPDRVFHGAVSHIEPILVDTKNYQGIQALVDLNDVTLAGEKNLVLGMNASVEVISYDAANILLIPRDALIVLDDGTYSVKVLMDQRDIVERRVEIGKMDYMNAEIKSGVTEGETLIVAVKD